MIDRAGSKNSNWRGGRRRTKDGYIGIYMPDHPAAGVNKIVLEHRLMMEQHLGRFLTDDEIVHHLNEIKDDNRIGNFELLLKGPHMSLHTKGRPSKRKGVKASPETSAKLSAAFKGRPKSEGHKLAIKTALLRTHQKRREERLCQ